MKNYPRHRANTPKDIWKETYDELIASAKRKHTDEFFVFFFGGLFGGWYSESSVDIFGDAIEHWTKKNGRWHKEGDLK